MSTIGRVFLVLNLILAGIFVGFAGTYLQRDADWRSQHDVLKTDTDNRIKELTRDYGSERTKLEEQKRVNSQLTTNVASLNNEIEKLRADNTTKERRLGEFEGTLKQLSASMGKMDAALSTTQNESKTAMMRAIAAEKAQQEAVAAMDQAKKELDEANFKIKNNEQHITEQDAQLAKLTQDLREEKVLTGLYQERAPGLLSTIQPAVSGQVTNVGTSRNTVTIAVNAGAEHLKPGASFAIWDGNGYKGEAHVTDYEPGQQFCFARVERAVGEKIQVGDSAATNLSRVSGTRGN